MMTAIYIFAAITCIMLLHMRLTKGGQVIYNHKKRGWTRRIFNQAYPEHYLALTVVLIVVTVVIWLILRPVLS